MCVPRLGPVRPRLPGSYRLSAWARGTPGVVPGLDGPGVDSRGASGAGAGAGGGSAIARAEIRDAIATMNSLRMMRREWPRLAGMDSLRPRHSRARPGAVTQATPSSAG